MCYISNTERQATKWVQQNSHNSRSMSFEYLNYFQTNNNHFAEKMARTNNGRRQRELLLGKSLWRANQLSSIIKRRKENVPEILFNFWWVQSNKNLFWVKTWTIVKVKKILSHSENNYTGKMPLLCLSYRSMKIQAYLHPSIIWLRANLQLPSVHDSNPRYHLDS